jgi:hypothetical protein
MSYDFEDGTTQGFYLRTDLSDLVFTAVQNGPAPSSGHGAKSLQMPMLTGGGNVDLDLNICGGSSVPISAASHTISVWFYLAGTLDTTKPNILQVQLWASNQMFSTFAGTGAANTTFTANTWTQLSATVDPTVAATYPYLTGLTFQGQAYTSGAATMYIDDLVWQ